MKDEIIAELTKKIIINILKEATCFDGHQNK